MIGAKISVVITGALLPPILATPKLAADRFDGIKVIPLDTGGDVDVIAMISVVGTSGVGIRGRLFSAPLDTPPLRFDLESANDRYNEFVFVFCQENINVIHNNTHLV